MNVTLNVRSFTETAHVALTPEPSAAVAVMLAVPAPTAVTLPFASTVATDVLSDAQTTPCSARDVATDAVSVRLSRRHSEILALLVAHPAGLSAEALSAELYGTDNTLTLRAEMARLKRVLEKSAPELVPESRPYRLTSPLETDAYQVRSLLQRGAHRAAVAGYLGDVLPGSTAPGIEAMRNELTAALRERVLSDSSLDVLLDYLDSDLGHEDREAWQLALRLLPPKSPRRALAVARIEALDEA